MSLIINSISENEHFFLLLLASNQKEKSWNRNNIGHLNFEKSFNSVDTITTGTAL